MCDTTNFNNFTINAKAELTLHHGGASITTPCLRFMGEQLGEPFAEPEYDYVYTVYYIKTCTEAFRRDKEMEEKVKPQLNSADRIKLEQAAEIVDDCQQDLLDGLSDMYILLCQSAPNYMGAMMDNMIGRYQHVYAFCNMKDLAKFLFPKLTVTEDAYPFMPQQVLNDYDLPRKLPDKARDYLRTLGYTWTEGKAYEEEEEDKPCSTDSDNE